MNFTLITDSRLISSAIISKGYLFMRRVAENKLYRAFQAFVLLRSNPTYYRKCFTQDS